MVAHLPLRPPHLSDSHPRCLVNLHLPHTPGQPRHLAITPTPNWVRALNVTNNVGLFPVSIRQ